MKELKHGQKTERFHKAPSDRRVEGEVGGMFRMLKKICDKFDENPKWTVVMYKAVTITAAAISVGLILAVALTEYRSASRIPDGASSHAMPRMTDSSMSAPGTSGTDVKARQNGTASAAPSGDTDVPPETLSLTLTDREASALIALALKKRLPIDKLSIAFAAPDVVTVNGKIKRDKLGEFVKKEGLPLADAALLLAPDVLDGSMAFKLALDADDRLTATPQKVAVSGVDITKFIPSGAVESFNEAMRSMLPDKTSVRSLDIKNGSVTFTLTA